MTIPRKGDCGKKPRVGNPGDPKPQGGSGVGRGGGGRGLGRGMGKGLGQGRR